MASSNRKIEKLQRMGKSTKCFSIEDKGPMSPRRGRDTHLLEIHDAASETRHSLFRSDDAAVLTLECPREALDPMCLHCRSFRAQYFTPSRATQKWQAVVWCIDEHLVNSRAEWQRGQEPVVAALAVISQRRVIVFGVCAGISHVWVNGG